ncbi:unnamed protein product [Urochloa humidicola]
MAAGKANAAPASCPSQRRPYLRRRPDPARGVARGGWRDARRGADGAGRRAMGFEVAAVETWRGGRRPARSNGGRS